MMCDVYVVGPSGMPPKVSSVHIISVCVYLHRNHPTVNVISSQFQWDHRSFMESKGYS